jgi:hypothetical protein
MMQIKRVSSRRPKMCERIVMHKVGGNVAVLPASVLVQKENVVLLKRKYIMREGTLWFKADLWCGGNVG